MSRLGHQRWHCEIGSLTMKMPLREFMIGAPIQRESQRRSGNATFVRIFAHSHMRNVVYCIRAWPRNLRFLQSHRRTGIRFARGKLETGNQIHRPRRSYTRRCVYANYAVPFATTRAI